MLKTSNELLQKDTQKLGLEGISKGYSVPEQMSSSAIIHTFSSSFLKKKRKPKKKNKTERDSSVSLGIF